MEGAKCEMMCEVRGCVKCELECELWSAQCDV